MAGQVKLAVALDTESYVGVLWWLTLVWSC